MHLFRTVHIHFKLLRNSGIIIDFFPLRQLDHLNTRLSHDIASIFAILTENTHQQSSLLSNNVHLQTPNDTIKIAPDSIETDITAGSVPLLQQYSGVIPAGGSPGTLLPTKDLGPVMSSSTHSSKPRASSAINISCQTPQSQPKRSTGSSGGLDLSPRLQVDF